MASPIDYTEIERRRGETLSATIAITGDDPDNWGVYGSLGRTRGGNEVADLSPTRDGANWIIEFDTNPLAPGTYWFDVKAIDPDGNEHWSDPVKIKLVEPNTKPS